jgi:acetyl esterase/lipase
MLRSYAQRFEADKLPVLQLVYFHGRGVCLGTIHACCLCVATELPAVVLSADYRLAPKHRLPEAIDDSAAALSCWLRGPARPIPR